MQPVSGSHGISSTLWVVLLTAIFWGVISEEDVKECHDFHAFVKRAVQFYLR
jgi:hypothetical protein